jgi:hypothetical protein
MTRIMACTEDLSLMGDFLEDTRLAFLMVPFGASMEGVNALLWELTSFLGRRKLPTSECVGGRSCARSLSVVCPSAELDSAAVAGVAGGGGCEVCFGRHGVGRNLRWVS